MNLPGFCSRNGGEFRSPWENPLVWKSSWGSFSPIEPGGGQISKRQGTSYHGTNLDSTTKRIQRPRFNNQNVKDSTTGYHVILEFPKIVLFEIPSSFKPHLIFFSWFFIRLKVEDVILFFLWGYVCQVFFEVGREQCNGKRSKNNQWIFLNDLENSTLLVLFFRFFNKPAICDSYPERSQKITIRVEFWRSVFSVINKNKI